MRNITLFKILLALDLIIGAEELYSFCGYLLAGQFNLFIAICYMIPLVIIAAALFISIRLKKVNRLMLALVPLFITATPGFLFIAFNILRIL